MQKARHRPAMSDVRIRSLASQELFREPLNHQVGELGKRIATKLEIQVSSLQNGGVKRWIVPFCGKRTRDGYCWKLRPELQQAMQEMLGHHTEFCVRVLSKQEPKMSPFREVYVCIGKKKRNFPGHCTQEKKDADTFLFPPYDQRR